MDLPPSPASPKPMLAARHIAGAGVGRHDQDDVAEVGLAAVVVGQRRVVHHLEQDVEQVRVRLLDLVEHQHGVRRLADRVGQQAALVEADVAGRRADQPRHGVLLHVLGHVEAEELDAAAPASCLASSVLPTPVGPANRKLPIGFSGARRPERASLIAARARRSRRPGRRSTRFSSRRGCCSARLSSLDTACAGTRAIFATTTLLDLRRGADRRRRARSPPRPQLLRRAGLVDHVDRLVGQVQVVDVPRRQLTAAASAASV